MKRHPGAMCGVCALLAWSGGVWAEVIDSGYLENDGVEPAVIYSTTVDMPGAYSTFLVFQDVLLSGDEQQGTGSYLVITSMLDDAEQTMHASHVEQWLNRSAFFNGDSLEVELIAYPGTGLNRILFEPTAGFAGSVPDPYYDCIDTDERSLSSDRRVGRVLNSSGMPFCTAFLIDDACHCLLTAGHCNGSLYVVEFGVPLSSTEGHIAHAPPEHQYAVDRASRRFNNDGGGVTGNDWSYFGCFPNSNTGLAPFEAQGGCYSLASEPPEPTGQTARATGYGSVSTPMRPTWNRVQKTHSGPYTYYAWDEYYEGHVTVKSDVTVSDGNSGSPMTLQDTCEVIGIMTDRTCNLSTITHANIGTAVNQPDLLAALAAPLGVCEPDCNENAIPDRCDIDCGEPGGPCDVPGCGLSEDCSGNGVPDECEPDCNTNDVADSCDILSGTSADCGGNGIPDECEPDCNDNQEPDDCDIFYGTSDDCNCNRVPDECDLDPGTSIDCNTNGIPDECEDDCNANGIADECDVDPLDPDGNGEVSEDCTGDGIPDECDWDCDADGVADSCEILTGTALDCNFNGLADECDLYNRFSDDCNENQIPDECDVAEGPSQDCNENGIPDECETWTDCNTNGVPDECDIADSTSEDCNANGIPDECDVAGLGGLLVARSLPIRGIVDLYDAASGRYVGAFVSFGVGGLRQPLGMSFHPNSNLLVANEDPHTVREYDGVTGAYLGDFVAAEAGGLYSPWDMTFGADGNLFVANVESGGVGITGILEYDGDTGASLGTFATAELQAPYGLTFGPGGNLFVCDHATAEVVEFDGDTGGLVGVFASPDGVALDGPSALAFHAVSGNLFVADAETNDVVEFNGTTGALVGVFVDDVGAYGAASLMDLRFGPDDHLYVSHKESNSIFKYNGSTGALLAELPESDFPLMKPFRLAFRLPLPDCNGNGIPDACECVRGDLTGDDLVNGLDIQPFIDCLLDGDIGVDDCYCADMDRDEALTTADIPCFVLALLGDWETCHIDEPCPSGGGPRGMEDCNDNGIPDANDMADCDDSAWCGDCDQNFVLDECDIALCLSTDTWCRDLNDNGIPDGCEPDCNKNDIPDDKDIADETSDDVNSNGIPDECDPDCNDNDVPDDWDISQETSDDCNEDGIPDGCEGDCNENGVPDDCDIDPSDPDGNEEVSEDCNENGIPDECDLSRPLFPSFDCNDNLIPDECDLADCLSSDPSCQDCNENGFLDGCDIEWSISEDENENGIPDECEGGRDGSGGGGGDEDADTDEAWAELFEWSLDQQWGPTAEASGSEQFQTLVDKLRELGLPLKNPWR